LTYPIDVNRDLRARGRESMSHEAPSRRDASSGGWSSGDDVSPVQPGSNRLATLAFWLIGAPLLTTVLVSAVVLGW
jgi:hypothetical protein